MFVFFCQQQQLYHSMVGEGKRGIFEEKSQEFAEKNNLCTGLKNAISAVETVQEYDENVKTILAHKIILAHM